MTARELAYHVLLAFEESKKRIEYLISLRGGNKKLSSKERKFLNNLCSGVTRHLNLLDWKVRMLYRGNYNKALIKFKVLLRLAIYEIDFLDFIPPHASVNEYVNLAKRKLDKKQSAIINGILRTYLREGVKTDPIKKFKYPETQISVMYSYPEWMITKWIDYWGVEETRALCDQMNQRPIFDIRINESKISVDSFLHLIIENDTYYEKSLHFKNVVKLYDVQKIIQLGLFEKGFCSIQDESALLVLDLLDLVSQEPFLDACAAPGGKYTAILDKQSSPAPYIAVDIDRDRINLIKQNCERLGLFHFQLVQGDMRNPPFKKGFMNILIDAPCSGLGTIQKHPDIKWRCSFEQIKQFQTTQLALLEAADGILKQGGLLVYSTCTIANEENEVVIDKFLNITKNKYELISPPNHLSGFTVEKKYIRTFPHKHKMDGSFAAILRKSN